MRPDIGYGASRRYVHRCRLSRPPPRSFRSLFAPLDEGFEALVVVGQGLGEGEELGDGVCARW